MPARNVNGYAHFLEKLERFYFDQNDTVLFVIDIQDKLSKAIYNEDTLKKNAKVLVDTAKILNIPTIITEQYPKGLGHTNEEIMNASENSYVIEKNAFTAFDENIKNILIELGKTKMIMCGMETHICVQQTTLDLLAAGYEVAIASDATGSRTEYNHNNGLDMMRSMGALITNTESILFSIMKSSSHPKFKEIQNLIK